MQNKPAKYTKIGSLTGVEMGNVDSVNFVLYILIIHENF